MVTLNIIGAAGRHRSFVRANKCLIVLGGGGERGVLVQRHHRECAQRHNATSPGPSSTQCHAGFMWLEWAKPLASAGALSGFAAPARR